MTLDDSDSTSGRRPRAGESGAPIGSILSIVLAVVAVAVGLFILSQIDGDDGGVQSAPDSTEATQASGPGNGDGSTPTNGTGGSNPGDTTTTVPINVRKGATVVVANANTTGGSALQMSEQLRVAGFTMGDPTDAVGVEKQLDVSKVYFVDGDAAARDVAATAARLLGGVPVAMMPGEIPVDGGRIDGKVLVMLGVREAGKPLDQLSRN